MILVRVEWKSRQVQVFGTLEFGVSKVSRERDQDIVEEKTQNKGEETRGSIGGFLLRFV